MRRVEPLKANSHCLTDLSVISGDEHVEKSGFFLSGKVDLSGVTDVFDETSPAHGGLRRREVDECRTATDVRRDDRPPRR